MSELHRCRVATGRRLDDQAGWNGAKDLKVPENISLLPLPPLAGSRADFGPTNPLVSGCRLAWSVRSCECRPEPGRA